MDLLKEALTSEKSTLATTFQRVADLIWYIFNMATKCKTTSADSYDDKRTQAWMLAYKTVLEEVNEVSMYLVNEGSVEPINKLILFCQHFLSEGNFSKEKLPMSSISKTETVEMQNMVINLSGMGN